MSLTTITIDHFIQCACDLKEKPENWSDIFSDYLEATENGSSSAAFILNKDALVLQNKAFLILALVNAIEGNLLTKDLKEAHAIIRSLNSRPKLGPMTKNELKMHTNLAMSLLAKSKEKQAELQNIIEKNTSSLKMEDWYEQVSHISKFLGYRLDPKTACMIEFCVALKGLKKEINKSNKNGK